MPPVIERVDHIHVHVTNLAVAEKWYAEVLGFTRIAELEFWAPGNGPLTIGDAAGNVHIALFEKPDTARLATGRATIALGVSAEAFLAWRAHLVGVLGNPIDVFDHEVTWSLYFSDPDGNSYEITTDQYAALTGKFK
jgi:catechol-2,3-dioxygenase